MTWEGGRAWCVTGWSLARPPFRAEWHQKISLTPDNRVAPGHIFDVWVQVKDCPVNGTSAVVFRLTSDS